MLQLTRLWDYVLNANQENQPQNIDSREIQMSNEASSTSSPFYLVSQGIVKNSSMPSRNEATPEPEMSSLLRRLGKVQLDDLPRSGATYPDSFRKNLEREVEQLQRRQAKMIRRIKGRMQELETLKRRDEEEQWEDGLLETRKKELEGANTIIETRSSVSKEDIVCLVKGINEQIIRISSVSVVAGPERQHRSHLYDAIANALGYRFLPFFQKCGYSLEEQTIKTLIQIYLARICATIICFWIHDEYLNARLSQLYDLLVINESQLIAGKWRQMAFKQLPRGPEQEVLQQATVDIFHKIHTIASCAGWGGGNVSEVQALVEDLVMKARVVREYAKAGLISADIHAWVANAGDMYDPATMEGANNGTGVGSLLLGSTGVGLSVRYASSDDGVAFQPLLPSKVFCIRG